MTTSDLNTDDRCALAAPIDATATRRHRVLRGLFLTAICGLILVSTRAFIDYGRLAAALAGGSLAERGMLGADEWRSFLSRAGRLDTQRSYRDARKLGVLDRQVSGLAFAWSWVVQTGDRLPPDARIYLNLPNSVLYFFGTTVWYPREVAIGPGRALIKDDETMQAASESLDPDRFHELRARGYTHVVTMEGDRLFVADLREDAGAPRP